MAKEIKSFKYTDKKTLKVGDEVFLGDMETTSLFKDKCSMCYYELYPERIIENLIITEDKPCWGHESYNLIHEIGAKKMLRIEQWRDGSAWRAGIEWYGEDNYEFICEQKTLLECLRMIKEYLNK